MLDTRLLHVTVHHPTDIVFPSRACLTDKGKRMSVLPLLIAPLISLMAGAPTGILRITGLELVGDFAFLSREMAGQARQGGWAGVARGLLCSARPSWWNLPWGRPRPLTAASLRWEKNKLKRELKLKKPLSTLPRLYSKKPRAKSNARERALHQQKWRRQQLPYESPRAHSPVFPAFDFVSVNINIFSTEITIVFWFYLHQPN